MWLVIAYVAFIAYAAVLFVYAVSHERPLAALGILLSVTGFQFALMDTLSANLSIAVAVAGLVMVGRDVYQTLAPRFAFARMRSHAADNA
jgi:hypothetical protein